MTYNSLKPGSLLNFVEVKNLSVDDDGQVNARTGAGNPDPETPVDGDGGGDDGGDPVGAP